MRSDLDKGSACRVGSAFTADMTTTPGNGGAAADPVLDMELARMVKTYEIEGTATSTHWDRGVELVYEPNYPPFLVGPCSLLVYFGGTVANIGGFAQLMWVEGPARDMLPAVAGL